MDTIEITGVNQERKDAKEKTSIIILHFLRHGEKENDKTKPDSTISLTEKGRQQAILKSSPETDNSQSLAFGSPRRRTQETAALVMAGSQDTITGEESFGELKEKLDQSLKVGTKIAVDKRLDINDTISTPYGTQLLDEIKAGRFLKFLVEQSDELANNLHDAECSTYSRLAKGVAEIILKYINASSRWHELVNDSTKNYTETLQRFFGSHQTVLECFLAKVIEKNKGQTERNQFVSLLGNNGFNFTEGFTVEISDTGKPEEIRIHLSYQKDLTQGEPYVLNEDISMELLRKIAESA